MMHVVWFKEDTLFHFMHSIYIFDILTFVQHHLYPEKQEARRMQTVTAALSATLA